MGMTIDKTIEFFNGLECHTPQAKDAKDVAVDTMHKYQKIKEIMDELNDNFYGSFLKDRQAIDKIYEVIEDGKID